MDRHVLFFDIDGTLIDGWNGKPKISDELHLAFKQLKENGHICFIASGRPLAYLNKDILSLPFDGYLTCNGATVIMNDEIIIDKCFPTEIVENITSKLDSRNKPYSLNHTKEIYSSKSNNEHINELFGNAIIDQAQVYYDYDLKDILISKFEIRGIDDEILTYLKEYQQKGYQLIEYDFIKYCELTMPGATKGTTIIELLDKLNVPIKNSIAFGDGDNDIEMLQVVGRGVCMGNGTDKAKAAADTITESCKDEGIVRELQRLGLIQTII